MPSTVANYNETDRSQLRSSQVTTHRERAGYPPFGPSAWPPSLGQFPSLLPAPPSHFTYTSQAAQDSSPPDPYIVGRVEGIVTKDGRFRSFGVRRAGFVQGSYWPQPSRSAS